MADAAPAVEDPREKALVELKKKLLAHREAEARVKTLREEVRTIKKDYDKTEDDLKALQSVGQIIGEVLRQLDEERCECGWRGGLVASGRRSGRGGPAWGSGVDGGGCVGGTARLPLLTLSAELHACPHSCLQSL